MPNTIQVKRGTNDKVSVYTPLVGEPVWDTTNNQLRVGDGSTVGGVLVGKTYTYASTSYSSTITIDFDGPEYTSISPTGSLIFTNTLNKAAPKFKEIQLIGDTIPRTMTFPSDWYWATNIPTELRANKKFMLKLQCYGTAETDVIASYSGYMSQTNFYQGGTIIPDPVCYWRFNELGLIPKEDQMGNMSLITTGNPVTINGPVGSASLVKHGVVSHTGPAISASTPTFNYTMCFLYNRSSSVDGQLMSKAGSSAVQWAFDTINTCPRIITSVSKVVSSGIATITGSWYFIAGRLTPDFTMSICVTNISASTLNPFVYSASVDFTDKRVGLLNVSTPNNNVAHFIDELGLWNTALSDTQIEYIFQTFKAGQSIR